MSWDAQQFCQFSKVKSTVTHKEVHNTPLRSSFTSFSGMEAGMEQHPALTMLTLASSPLSCFFLSPCSGYHNVQSYWVDHYSTVVVAGQMKAPATALH